MTDSSATTDPTKGADSTAGERWRCTECNDTMEVSDIDSVQDPKSDNIWSVCPHCRTPEHFDLVCDEPGCMKIVSSGWPTPDGGYRRTCYLHSNLAPAAPLTNPGPVSNADETKG